MKNFLLTFSILLLAFSMNAQCDISGVSITSILPDPSSATNNFDTDGDGNFEDDDEFVEICNTSAVSVNISNWTMTDEGNNVFTFPASTILAAGDCAVVLGDWDSASPVPSMMFEGLFALNNPGDIIELSDGTSICIVSYGDTNCGGAGNCDDWGNDTDGCPLLASGTDCLYVPSPIFNALMPVTLTSFEARPTENKSVSLQWQTASEENNDYFSIEHSIDGTSFREIATQVGNGTTDKIQNYSYIHEEVENGLHYYRLKQVDFDGKFEYTNIVTAKINRSSDDIFLTPNPSSNVIFVQTKTPYQRDADFQILNMQGQVVLTSVLQEGDTDMELNISDFPVGIYYLQLFVDNDVMMKKIIKQ
ncbi:MAG: lamin tail domain-containing protein [Saprospiraceae bacterium]